MFTIRGGGRGLLFAWNYSTDRPELRATGFAVRCFARDRAGTILFWRQRIFGTLNLGLSGDLSSPHRPDRKPAHPHPIVADLDCLKDVPFDKVIYIIGIPITQSGKKIPFRGRATLRIPSDSAFSTGALKQYRSKSLSVLDHSDYDDRN